jgi:hypothetical protein
VPFWKPSAPRDRSRWAALALGTKPEARMPELRLGCPSCGKRLTCQRVGVPASAKVRCPSCNTVFRLSERQWPSTQPRPQVTAAEQSWSFARTILCAGLFGFLGATGGAWAGVLFLVVVWPDLGSGHAQATGGSAAGLALLAPVIMLVLGGVMGTIAGFILGILRAIVFAEPLGLRRAWHALALCTGCVLVFWGPGVRLVHRTIPPPPAPAGKRVFAAPAPAGAVPQARPMKAE